MRETTDRSASIEKVAGAAAELGLGVRGVTASPLPGLAACGPFRMAAPRCARAGPGAAAAGDRGGTQLSGKAHDAGDGAHRAGQRDAQRPAGGRAADRCRDHGPHAGRRDELSRCRGGAWASRPPRAPSWSSSWAVTAACWRAAELSRPAKVPLIGVNLGHVGFLAEAEPDGLTDRSTVWRHGSSRRGPDDDRRDRARRRRAACAWLGAERASVEKAARERMIEVITEVEGRPLSRWGCDGVVCRPRPARPPTRFPRAVRWSGPGRGAAHRADQRACAVRSAVGLARLVLRSS